MSRINPPVSYPPSFGPSYSPSGSQNDSGGTSGATAILIDNFTASNGTTVDGRTPDKNSNGDVWNSYASGTFPSGQIQSNKYTGTGTAFAYNGTDVGQTQMVLWARDCSLADVGTDDLIRVGAFDGNYASTPQNGLHALIKGNGSVRNLSIVEAIGGTFTNKTTPTQMPDPGDWTAFDLFVELTVGGDSKVTVTVYDESRLVELDTWTQTAVNAASTAQDVVLATRTANDSAISDIAAFDTGDISEVGTEWPTA